MKYSEMEKKLARKGCYFFMNGKKHPVWYSPITKRMFDTGHHKSEEVSKGTLIKIRKLSGVNL
jgi:hypothetical protein